VPEALPKPGKVVNAASQLQRHGFDLPLGFLARKSSGPPQMRAGY